MIIQRINWVVLFGGAGRESILARMMAEGVPISLVCAPSDSSKRLDEACDRIRKMGLPITVISRKELNAALRPNSSRGLLSIGFPYILDREVVEMFHPAINVHPTLLPKFRGPTTGAHVLMSGTRESGSTVHILTPEIDRGDIIAQHRVALSDFESLRSMQRKVYALEPQLVIDAICALERGDRGVPQDERIASEFPRRRTPKDSELDPALPLAALVDHIRACDPEDFPAYFMHNGEQVCVRLWRPNKPIDESDLI